MNIVMFVADLAAIRRLLESEDGRIGGDTCPSCEMPFDKGKKRKLIDTCGHERCYTCMFTNEICPLCLNRSPTVQHPGETRHNQILTSISPPIISVATARNLLLIFRQCKILTLRKPDPRALATQLANYRAYSCTMTHTKEV